MYFNERIPNDGPELYPGRQETANRKDEQQLQDADRYAANRKKIQDAINAGHVIIDYCGYDSRCHNCQYADSDTQINADDDFCSIICKNPGCPLHAENGRPE